MVKHAWLVGALALGLIASGCGRGNDHGRGTRGAAGTSGTDVVGGTTMTLRGCVEAGIPAGTYVLRSTATGDEERGGTTGTSGNRRPDVNGVVPDQESGATYRLIATGSLDIGSNLGKEVAITGELARQARDNAGTVGLPPSGRAAGDRARRDESGQGGAGSDLESGGSRGSGNGRVQGSASDDLAGARFFRVTSMTKVSDHCAAGQR
jgi:hypothetical protein